MEKHKLEKSDVLALVFSISIAVYVMVYYKEFIESKIIYPFAPIVFVAAAVVFVPVIIRITWPVIGATFFVIKRLLGW